MNIGKNIAERFRERYGARPAVIVSAPGRVNLIGEHTDYNLGLVLPMAIDRRIWAAGGMIDKHLIRLSSDNQEEVVEVKGTIRRQGNWSDYPLGVVWSLQGQGYMVQGMEMHFWGNIPVGGGLSSSAAIEIATGLLVRELCDLKINLKEIARICQVAENSFVGMKCGIMDQMASALSKKDHALYIDCRDLSFENIPLDLGDYRIAIINSGVERKLTGSGYNRRRAECEEAAKRLKVKSLREVNADDFPRIEKLPPPLNRRVRHIVSENHRVKDAVKHLRAGDLDGFGQLMRLSHQSLRDDYEVSTPELDWLVEKASYFDGVPGARLTGAGFGGCVIALAHNDAIKNFNKSLLTPYRKKFNIQPELIVSSPDDGARIETKV